MEPQTITTTNTSDPNLSDPRLSDPRLGDKDAAIFEQRPPKRRLAAMSCSTTSVVARSACSRPSTPTATRTCRR